jgi:transposase-like protein
MILDFPGKSGRMEKSILNYLNHPNYAYQENLHKRIQRTSRPISSENGNISETARSLGLHDSILRGWKMELEQNAEKAFPGKGHSQDEELRQLQRENQRLKETVEILEPMLHS